MTSRTRWIGIGLLAPLFLVGCYAEGHYAPVPPPPPPLEPPPGAPPPTFANVAPAPTPASDPPPAPPAPPSAPPQATASAQSESHAADGSSTQVQAAPLPPLPSQAPVYGSPQAVPPPVGAPSEDGPSPATWVRSYPNGQWVYTTDYGWIWVPAGTATTASEGVPYTYLYTPRYGWTWYVSPWGWGPYHYGVWVSRPWHPYGWHHGWVAHPRVVVRLGGHRRR